MFIHCSLWLKCAAACIVQLLLGKRCITGRLKLYWVDLKKKEKNFKSKKFIFIRVLKYFEVFFFPPTAATYKYVQMQILTPGHFHSYQSDLLRSLEARECVRVKNDEKRWTWIFPVSRVYPNICVCVFVCEREWRKRQATGRRSWSAVRL